LSFHNAGNNFFNGIWNRNLNRDVAGNFAHHFPNHRYTDLLDHFIWDRNFIWAFIRNFDRHFHLHWNFHTVVHNRNFHNFGTTSDLSLHLHNLRISHKGLPDNTSTLCSWSATISTGSGAHNSGSTRVDSSSGHSLGSSLHPPHSRIIHNTGGTICIRISHSRKKPLSRSRVAD